MCITIIFILLFAYCICRLKINCLTLRKFINRSKKSKRPETYIDTIELYQKVNFENKSDDEIIGNPQISLELNGSNAEKIVNIKNDTLTTTSVKKFSWIDEITL